MIIWLASYPRSGNTLLRMMFKEVFGRDSFSKYDDPHDIGADEKTAQLVGHRMLGEPWKNAYPRLSADPQLHLVKTHDGPEDAGKAIYVAREGRSAAVSYFKYLSRFPDVPPIELADIIGGFITFGSWSAHLDAWDPLHRPNTLFLTFEQLLTDPNPQIARIAEFCQIEPRQDWRNDFASAQRINPVFFRQGSAEKSIADVQGDDLLLFWQLHGDWMGRLGYGQAPPNAGAAPAVVRRLIQRHQARAEAGAEEAQALHAALAARAGDIASLEEQLRIGALEIGRGAEAVASIRRGIGELSNRIDRWNGPGSPPNADADPTPSPNIHVAMQEHARQAALAREAVAQLDSRLSQLEQFTLRPPPMPLKLIPGEVVRRFTGGRSNSTG